MTAKELKLDYFKFYDVANREVDGDVLLRGQFDQRPQKMRLRLLDYFANPVSKNNEPLYDKNAHLAWYRGVQPSEPPRRVVLENQFGKFDIRTGTGYGLLVPTQKVEPGSVFPNELDHYKVYRLLDVKGGERLGHFRGPPFAFPFPLIRSSQNGPRRQGFAWPRLSARP